MASFGRVKLVRAVRPRDPCEPNVTREGMVAWSSLKEAWTGVLDLLKESLKAPQEAWRK